MKIALLHGAVKNGGDFLIKRKSVELLRTVYPNLEISEFLRTLPLTENQVEEINRMDAIVISGGPFYKWNLYPDYMPLCNFLEQIKPPFFCLGGGGEFLADVQKIWNERFSISTLQLLRRAIHDTGALGCRDYYAIRILMANGLKNILMTGCPAWYDPTKIGERLTMRPIEKIAVSDPANPALCGAQSVAVVRCLREQFPGAEIHYMFHRDLTPDANSKSNFTAINQRMKTELEDLGIRTHNLAYSDAGFAFYNNCDLHVGHRVHAHIYALSQRRPSILLEEDLRGRGVNEALGLVGVQAFSRRRIARNFFSKVANHTIFRPVLNDYALRDLEAYLQYLMETDFHMMNLAYASMEFYYDKMLSHVQSLFG